MNCNFRIPTTVTLPNHSVYNTRKRCGKKGHLYLKIQFPNNKIKYICFCKDHQHVIFTDSNKLIKINDKDHEYLFMIATSITIIHKNEIPSKSKNQYKETKQRIKNIMKQKNNIKLDWQLLFEEALKELIVESVMEE